MPLTDAGEDDVLTHLMTGAWISLHNGPAIPSNEVTGANYSRVLYGDFTIVAGDPSQCKNTNLVEFPVAGGTWGFVQSFGVWDSNAGGIMTIAGVLPSSKEVLNGDVARFPPGTLIITAK